MKKIILSLALALGLVTGANAGGGDTIAWDKAPNKINDLAALQNGAKLFVNHCLNCHSAAFMRYNRLTDIGLTEQQIKDNLLFTTDKVGDTMKANIDPKQAKEWFGANPPDLTVIARSRAGHGGTGADYLYTWHSPMWVCRMCFGRCKAFAVLFLKSAKRVVTKCKSSRAGNKSHLAP
jgi:ubiquinol-cytochrome c reductase cytochrome c1 subunit